MTEFTLRKLRKELYGILPDSLKLTSLMQEED